MPHAIDCHSGRCDWWLRWATRLPKVETITAIAVYTAPSATSRLASSLANSGQKTSAMPTMPSTDPSASTRVIGVPKKARMPSIPSNGLAE